VTSDESRVKKKEEEKEGNEAFAAGMWTIEAVGVWACGR
jgi:hypothetical protein